MQQLLLRADQAELRLCLRINGWSRSPAVRRGFRIVSRLGDGVLWYSVLALLAALGGPAGVRGMLHVGLTSLVGVQFYAYLKNRLVRPRPYVSHGQIQCQIAPLDQYSFPSGHTLHAVLFTSMFAVYAPAVSIALLPFVALIALSRIVLGLHYPSDVAVGALLGLLIAAFSLTLVAPVAIDYATGWHTFANKWF